MKNPQHYSSIFQLTLRHKLILPKPTHWWLLTETITGEVNGIPKLRGQAVATNGILAAVENSDGIFFCHREWFNPDLGEPSFDEAESREPRASIQIIALSHNVFV